MVYLYYYDGRLAKAPTKLHSTSKIIEELNKWNSKIDATNGETSCLSRLTKIIEKNKALNNCLDFHILTNSYRLKQFAETCKKEDIQCLFTYDEESGHWLIS